MPARSRCALLALLVLLGLLAGPGAAAAQQRVPVPPTGPLFGPELDWGRDTARAYADRLGAPPSLYAKPARFPFDADEARFVDEFAVQVARQRATAVLSLEPEGPLRRITDDVARDLADRLARYGRDEDLDVLVVLAPEMNAPYRPWGLQPQAFVDAFRRVAAAVHARAPRAAMVWQPAAGAGYPFAGAGALPAPGSPELARLDTDGDGALTGADDPYAPFHPGDDAVDWVGVTALHTAGGVAEEGAFLGLVGDLSRRYGERPLLVETAALHRAGAPDEVAVKGGWAEQVLGPATRDALPRLGAVVWLEVQRPEPVADDAVVDWRGTSTPAVAAALRSRLGGTTPGREVVEFEPRGPRAAAPQVGTTLRGPPAYAAAGLLLAAGLALLLVGLRRVRAGRGLRLSGPRDPRLDVLRGLAVCLVVLNHVQVTSLWHLLSQEALGPVSGAELFVLLSGVVLGQVHRPRLFRSGLTGSLPALWARAGTLWVTALVVAVACYAASRLPGVDGSTVTTYTDRGTGQVYDLYAGVEGLSTATPPGYLVRDVLLLRMGPFQFNIMGLYVVLLLAAPFLLLLLRRRLGVVLLGGSAALYALHAVAPVRLLPSQFEDAFPLLAWQLLFVLGLAAGWYRDDLVDLSRTAAGRVLVAGCVVLSLLSVLFAASSTYLSNAADVRLALLPDDVFRRVYGAAFERTALEPGRVLAALVLTVALLAALTAFWPLVERTLGPVLLPLGQATLYVFVLQVPLALVVGEVDALRDGGLVVGTLVHTACLALLWLAVRTRFLFRVVPR